MIKKSSRPLRIVHAANFGYKPTKAYLHNTAVKISNGLVRNGHHTINFSVRDIARWSGPFGNRRLGAVIVRRDLLKYCMESKPDLLILGHADLIDNNTILSIREKVKGIRVIQWNIDWLAEPGVSQQDDLSGINNIEKIISKNHVVDATFCTTGGNKLKNIGKKLQGGAYYMPNPVDSSIETGKNFERQALPYSVIFAVSSRENYRFHAGYWAPMDELALRVSKIIPEGNFAQIGTGRRGPVYGADYQSLLSSAAIGLNISRRNDIYLYSSDRLAQMCGNGVAICIDRSTGYGDLFGPDEFSFYSTTEELLQNIERMSNDDAHRMLVAKNGWSRYYEMFSADRVGTYFIDVAFDEHDPSDYLWPTNADRHPNRN